MRKRTVNKHIWLSQAEADALRANARRCGLTESNYLRLLILRYLPHQKPDERFYKEMRCLYRVAGDIYQQAVRANSSGVADADKLTRLSHQLATATLTVERAALRPTRLGKDDI